MCYLLGVLICNLGALIYSLLGALIRILGGLICNLLGPLICNLGVSIHNFLEVLMCNLVTYNFQGYKIVYGPLNDPLNISRVSLGPDITEYVVKGLGEYLVNT